MRIGWSPRAHPITRGNCMKQFLILIVTAVILYSSPTVANAQDTRPTPAQNEPNTPNVLISLNGTILLPPLPKGQVPPPTLHCTVTVAESPSDCVCNVGNGMTIHKSAACHSCKTAETGKSCSPKRCQSCGYVCNGGTPVSQSCPN